MKLIDLVIIYLTCGAPFGVYFYIQNRETNDSPNIWFKTILTTLFWFIYAIQLFHKVVTKKLINYRFAGAQPTDSFEKNISQLLLEEKSDISLFEFKETLERYVGLNEAINSPHQDDEAELYKISNHENKKLATTLLNRRNRLRLREHHILARQDFLKLIEKLYSSIGEKEKIRSLTFDFAKLINDVEAQTELHKIFENPPQLRDAAYVNVLENDVWNPSRPKQNHIPVKTLSFQTVSTRPTTSKTD